MEQIKGLKPEVAAQKDKFRKKFPQLYFYGSVLGAILHKDWWEKYKQSSHYARRIEKGSIRYEQLVYDQSLPIFKELFDRAVWLLSQNPTENDDYEYEKEAEELLYGKAKGILNTNFHWIGLGALEVIQKERTHEDIAGSSGSPEQVQASFLSITHRRCY